MDNQIISALWGICFLAQMWGIDKSGMLHRNDLITEEDTQTLNNWINAIAYAVMTLLDTGNVIEAFAGYEGRAGTAR